VCAILSIFPETRDWNRKNIKNYYEVYIETPIEILADRDSKGIYGKYKRGEISKVVGMDIDFPVPDKPDLVIKNINSKEELLSFAKPIIERILKS
jgi:adenylylsulfate kinase